MRNDVRRIVLVQRDHSPEPHAARRRGLRVGGGGAMIVRVEG